MPGSVHADANERPPVPEDKASMTPLEKSKLAYWYWKTERVSKLPRAVQLMTEAAEAGDSRSQAVLGDWYMRGIRETLPVDEAKSFYWNSKAAAQGQRTAQMAVGDNYYNGIVVQKNYAKSFEYFMKAAQQGWPVAELAVAEAYCTGEGVAENRAQALAWFNKSKADGCTSAQNFLDILALPNCPAHFSSFKELLSYGHGYEKVQADKMRAQSTAAIGQSKMITSPQGSDEYRRGQQIYNGAQQSINNANRTLNGYGH
jgi:TPR repeat protein